MDPTSLRKTSCHCGEAENNLAQVGKIGYCSIF
jgi:hypothetical protein